MICHSSRERDWEPTCWGGGTLGHRQLADRNAIQRVQRCGESRQCRSGNGVSSGAGAGQSYADVISDPHQNVPQFDPASGFGPFIANPDAFTTPEGLTLGDTARNFLRNPSRWNFDMALFKRFAIRESMAFEFRAEASTCSITRSGGPLAGDAGSAGAALSSGTGTFPGINFLQTGAVYSPRILQLGAKFVF